MRGVSYGVRCFLKEHRWTISGAEGGSYRLDKKPRLLTFLPADFRHPFAAVAETTRDIRRNLLPLTFPPEQSAMRPSSRRNADQSGRGHHRTSGRDANRSIFRGPQCAPYRKKYRAYPL